MDPTATLKELQALLAADPQDRTAIGEKAEALHNWLSSGGFMPDGHKEKGSKAMRERMAFLVLQCDPDCTIVSLEGGANLVDGSAVLGGKE